MRSTPVFLLFLALPLVGQGWAQATPATVGPAVRHAAAAYDLAHGQTVVFGGAFQTGLRSNQTWLYDGSSWMQASPATVPTVREQAAMCYDLANGQVVMYGGWASLADTWTWNGTDWTAHPAATGPGVRAGHCMAYDILRGKVVMFGGRSGNALQGSGAHLRDTWEWDGSAWTQVVTAAAPLYAAAGTMCYDLGRGRIVYTGGTDNGISDQSTWEYDGTNWTDVTTTVGSAPWGAALAGIGMTYAQLVYDQARGVCVLHGGGRPGVGGYRSESWELDGSSWCRVAVDPFPDDHYDSSGIAQWRYGFVMTYDVLNGVAVLAGGANGGLSRVFDQTWKFTGAVGSFVTFGAGCAGSAGVPAIGNPGGGVPTMGQTFVLECTNVPPTFAVGIASLASHVPGIDLTAVGMPGCFLHVDLDVMSVVPVTGGAAQWLVPISTDPSWYGLRAFWQWGVYDPGLNGLDLSLSNAAETSTGC
jgi:hypothetical protein